MEKTVNCLNQFLADLAVFYRKLQNFHWNVEGKDFFIIHAKLEEYYDDMNEQIDEIAEYILSIGCQPLGTMKDDMEITKIQEAENVKVKSDAVLSCLIKDYETVLQEAKQIKQESDTNNDAQTSTMMDDYIEDYSKKIYFNTLENYLNLIISGNLESFEIINDLIINKKKDIDRIRNILKEKEEYNNKIEKSEVKFNKLIKDYNEINELIKELNVKLDGEKDNFINILIENNRKHKEFILEDADLKEIINILADFNLDNYDLAKNKYDEIFQKYYQENTKKLSSLEVKLTDFNNELKDEENILSKLESEEEIELTDKELESETNLYLINNNINYISFYKAIEFKDDIDKNIKNSLEANLLSSGLLNAKIILLKDIKKVSNTNITYLVPSNKKKNNLSKYFNPIKNIKYFSEDYILSILESISIDETDISYINDKSYKFDVLHGYNNIYEAKYIGFLNRKNEHLKK